MKLSEAIRLGAMLGPQVFEVMFDGRGGSCALGAADLAINVKICGDWPDAFWRTVDSISECPACGIKSGHQFGGYIITHLNDDHRWTRAAIADFVELHEPMESAEAVPESETAVKA